MKYINQNYDQERALYGVEGAEIINCTFAGPADGESALKECRNIKVESCLFELRYPFWHVSGAEIRKAAMTETCRAALWYCEEVVVEESKLHGIKALRHHFNGVALCDSTNVKLRAGVGDKDCGILLVYDNGIDIGMLCGIGKSGHRG